MCEWWHKVCTLYRRSCSCVHIHPLIHHYSTTHPTSYWHALISYPTLPLFFPPLTQSLSLTTPSHWFRGFSCERKHTSCWASVTHFVQSWPASVDTAGHFKRGHRSNTAILKSLAYSTTLKIIIYFTDSVGIVGCTVADCENYTFLKKQNKRR